MFSDGINVKGNVHIEIYDTESGKLKEEFYHKNLVVDVGKKFIASRFPLSSKITTKSPPSIVFKIASASFSTPEFDMSFHST